MGVKTNSASALDAMGMAIPDDAMGMAASRGTYRVSRGLCLKNIIRFYPNSQKRAPRIIMNLAL